MNRKLNESDFVPLDRSNLPTWRWTQETHRLFSQQQLARIRALHPDAAARIHAGIFQGRHHDLVASVYDGDTRRPTGARHVMALAPEPVRRALSSWVPDPEQDVIVLWDKTSGTVIPWGFFCAFWDDFCYPGSDDNFIVPVEGAWLLWYYHEEQFWFLP